MEWHCPPEHGYFKLSITFSFHRTCEHKQKLEISSAAHKFEGEGTFLLNKSYNFYVAV